MRAVQDSASWNRIATFRRSDVELDLAQIAAIEADRAGVGVVQAHEHLRQRRLAGAAGADERQRLAGLEPQARPRRAPAARPPGS